MERSRGFLLLVIVALAWPVMAGAQETVDMTYTGNYDWVYDGYYVGPYTANLYPGGSGIDIYCVDSAHMISSNSWSAYVTRLGTGSLSNTYLSGVGDALDRYWKAAYLTTKFSYTGLDAEDVASIHSAIWMTTTGSLPSGFSAPTYSHWLDELGTVSYTNWRNMQDDGDWVVLTDVNGSSQEFLTHSSNVVPEPETWAMLLTGLGILGVGVLRGRVLG